MCSLDKQIKGLSISTHTVLLYIDTLHSFVYFISFRLRGSSNLSYFLTSLLSYEDLYFYDNFTGSTKAADTVLDLLCIIIA